MTQISSADCLIIGGGVVGLSLALEMADRGATVQLLDQERVGRAASWAGAGILPPSPLKGAIDPLDQLRGLSHRLHAQWAVRLRELTGIDTGYSRCGGLYLARSAGEAATLAAQLSLWDEFGIESQRWSTAETIEFEPNLAPLLKSESVKAVWYLPDECQLRNPRHLKALAAACQARGVRIAEHSPVTRIETNSNGTIRAHVNQPQAAATVFETRQLCICSGAWSRLLLDRLQVTTGILPIRGQMILYRADRPLLQRVVNEGHRYLVARADGRLLAGSCEEEVGFDLSTTETMIAQLRVWAEEVLPALKHTPIENTWAGLRPGSFDGLPYMGQVPGSPNLFVSSGHFRAGLHLSCASAVLMADLMQGKQPSIDLSPFRIGRG